VGFFYFHSTACDSVECAAADSKSVAKKHAPTRPATSDTKSVPAAPVAKPWPRGLKLIVSALVTFHVVAVFTGPWSAIPEQASPLARDFRSLNGWYVDPLFLSNGYRFFAPEPGPSHLIKYEVTKQNGEVIKGRFPDRATERPRLLYHRYFMLSEMANTLYRPQDVPPEERLVYNLYIRSYARHLARKYDAREVKLTLVEHTIPTIEEIQSGKVSLAHEHLYQELPLGTFQGDQL
jgi:hypothetical protein